LLYFGQDDLVSDASQETTAADDFADDESDFVLPPPKSKAEAKARAKAQKDAAERERIRVAKKRNAIIRKVRAMLDKTVANCCIKRRLHRLWPKQVTSSRSIS